MRIWQSAAQRQGPGELTGAGNSVGFVLLSLHHQDAVAVWAIPGPDTHTAFRSRYRPVAVDVPTEGCVPRGR